MNYAEQRASELDLTNKNHAHAIDDRMYQLRNNSARIGLFPGIEDIDNTYVSRGILLFTFTNEW